MLGFFERNLDGIACELIVEIYQEFRFWLTDIDCDLILEIDGIIESFCILARRIYREVDCIGAFIVERVIDGLAASEDF